MNEMVNNTEIVRNRNFCYLKITQPGKRQMVENNQFRTTGNPHNWGFHNL